MIRIRCTTCPATAHATGEGLPLGWGTLDAPDAKTPLRAVCPTCPRPRWFWYKESLLDDRPAVPLARLDPDGTWTWAPGEPRERSPFAMEVVASLPEMVAAEPDYRWNSPHENITEGEAWAIHPSGDPAIYTSPGPKWMPVPFADVALRMPRGPVSHVPGRLRLSSASPCPDCGEPVRRGLGCFCRPGETT